MQSTLSMPLCGESVGCGQEDCSVCTYMRLGFGVEFPSWCEAVREHDMARLQHQGAAMVIAG